MGETHSVLGAVRCPISLACCLAASLSGCALVDALEDEGDATSIAYPESGLFGLNLLDPSLTEAVHAQNYSFRAELSAASDLRVEVRNSASAELSIADVDPSGWGFSVGMDRTLIFVSLEGRGSPDLRVVPDIEGGVQPGDLFFDYYENGALTPSFSKVVRVSAPE